MKKIHKILIGFALIFFIPLTVFAVTATWQATSPTAGIIQPTSVNGVNQAINVTSTATSTIANFNTTLWVPTDFATNGCGGDPTKTDFGACVNKLNSILVASGQIAGQIMVPNIKITQAQWTTPINFSGPTVVSFDCVQGAQLQYGGTATSTLFNMSNLIGHPVLSDDYGCTYMGHSTFIAQGQTNSATTVGIGFGGSNGAPNVNFHDNTVNGFGQNIHIGQHAYMISIVNNAISGGNGGVLGDLLFNDHSNDSGEALTLRDNTWTDPANNLIGNDIYLSNGSLASAFILGKSLDDAQIFVGSSNGTVTINDLHIENSACQTGAYNAYIPILGVSSDQFTQINMSNIEIANDCSGVQSFTTIVRHGGQLYWSGWHLDNYGGGTVTNLVLHDLDNGLESEQVCKGSVAGGSLTNIIGGSGAQPYSLAASATCWGDTSNSFAWGSFIDGSNLGHFRNGSQDIATADDNGNWSLGVGSGSSITAKNTLKVITAALIATSTNGFNVALDVNGPMAVEGGNGIQLHAPVGNNNFSTIAYNASFGKVDTTWPWDFDDGGLSTGNLFKTIAPPTGGIISAGHVGIGTTTTTELLTIGRPASDNDYSTLAAWSGLVEGIFSASTPDLAVYAGSKNNYPFNLVQNNHSDLGIDTNGNVNVLSNSLQFNKGGSTGSTYQMTQTSDDILQIQRTGGSDNTFSEMNLVSNPGGDQESTFTTALAQQGANEQFIDWTLENYNGADPFGSINISSKGASSTVPFVIRFWNKGQFAHVDDITYGNWFDPSGAVAFGYGSTTPTNANPRGYNLTTAFQVSSSTAALLANFEDGVGNSRLSISGTGFGTTTLTGLNIAGSATSTSNVGYNITTGCYAIAGTCLSTGGGGSGTVTNVSTDSTLTGGPITTTGTLGINLTNPNTWTGLQTFANATATLLSSTYASSTVGIYGSIGIGTNANPAGGKLQIIQSADTSSGGFTITNTSQAASWRGWEDANNSARIDSGGTAAGNILLNGSGTGKVGIGTTTPTATFVEVAASTTAGTVQTGYTGVINIIAGLENTVVKLFQVIDQWGHLITSGDTPSVSGGTSSVSGNDRNGTITVTGTALTSVVLTFAHAYPSTPECQASTNSTASVVDIASISATSVTFGFSVGLSSNSLYYACEAHQ